MENVGYTNTYNQPVVLGQVITYNDPDFSVFWSSNGTQGNPPDLSNLYVGKHVGEDPGRSAWSDETLGYIIAEAGSGFSDGYFYELALGTDSVAGTGDLPPYSYALGDTYTYGVATEEAVDGVNGGWAVLYGADPLAGNQIDLAIEEETAAGDTTRAHTDEQVAYWVFDPTIGGTVWDDLNGDGNLEVGEPGYDNATVWLCPDTHVMPPAAPACQSSTTDTTGYYYFRDVAGGGYYFAVENPNTTHNSTAGGNHDPGINDQIDDGLDYNSGNYVVSRDFTHARITGSTRFDFGYALPGPENTTKKLPATGFAPNRVSILPSQPEQYSYRSYAELWLEIPLINVKLPIVGVPRIHNNWDVTWLGNKAGYLSGTAFPTWVGNTVITAHVWNANNTPGPFVDLKTLKYGDQVIIHAWGLKHIYEVRAVDLVSPSDLSVLSRSDYDMLTLLTCKGFDENRGIYAYRVAVQTILVDVRSAQE